MAAPTTREAELIARYIEPNPQKPQPANARLIESGVAVWALIGYLRAADGNVDEVTAAYDLSPIEMQAALAYYRQHKDAIEARLTLGAT